jgi:hypothetical protein
MTIDVKAITRDWLRDLAARARAKPLETIAAALAWTTIVVIVLVVASPWIAVTSTYGQHDWDVETSYRYLTKVALLRYHEAPLWNPYACGGFPDWSYVEGGTVLVSPWLPAYLAFSMPIALRVEAIGMACIGAIGAYALAGRFTRGHAARALVVALWAVNGRWALQAAAGHTWHFAYAWMPWCFYFFERAREGARRLSFTHVVAMAACLAMLVYSGGIYPLPHTILALSLYAAAICARDRSLRPLVVLASSGALALGLAAPKMLPMLETFTRAPRAIESSESLSVSQLFTLLTHRDQIFHAHPFRAKLGWHEYGMYVSIAGVLVLALALLFAWKKPAPELKLVGVVFLVLGFGAFHPAAPWSLLHAHVPIFTSQHVPFRFLYPAVLFLALAAAIGVGALTEKRAWLDAALALLVLVLGIDVASVARKPMTESMRMTAPNIPENDEMHFVEKPPYRYKELDWVGPMYLAMLANRGVIDCYGTPPFGEKGARAIDDARYRGEVYDATSDAEARVTSWSPSHADVALRGARTGDVVVYNMNYDAGWRSDAGEVVRYEDKVAVRLDAEPSTLTFTYRPRSFAFGVSVGVLTLVGCAVVFVRDRRRRARGTSLGAGA